MTAPFPIQAATLPNSLAGRDVLGRGRTGSGKTLAFGLALLARTAGQRAEPRQPLALVLVPTRELAQQVTDALTPYARSLPCGWPPSSAVCRSAARQAPCAAGPRSSSRPPDGSRTSSSRGDCRLNQVAITVLDEADQMADMGFMPQVTALLDQVRPEGQRMLFSATLDRNVDLLVRRYLTDPVVHSVDPSAGAVTTMEHHLLHVRDADKHATTTEIAAREGRSIMFLDTKHAVDKLTKHLLSSGVRAAALHGGKSQPQRTRTLAQFKTGHVTVLVATNVAARGIHVDNLDLVVNVDPPTRPQGLPAPRRSHRPCGRVGQRRHPRPAQPAPRDGPPDGRRGHHPAVHPGPLRRGRTEPDHRRPDALRHSRHHRRAGRRASQAQRILHARPSQPLRPGPSVRRNPPDRDRDVAAAALRRQGVLIRRTRAARLAGSPHHGGFR